MSGIPFTSERQLTGNGPAEATATIVRRVLGELGIAERTILWNVVPTHPHRPRAGDEPAPDRARGRFELPVSAALAARRRVVAVGRLAESALGIEGVRHPSHGGARAFRDGLRTLVDSQALEAGRCDALGAGRLLESAAGGRQVRPLSAR